MAAPRATASALRNISKSVTQVRNLSMTGPATYSSPLLTTEKPSFQKVQAAISDAASKTDTEAYNASTAPARKFNTSRTLKAVGDTSTIDFAYLPDLDPDAGIPPPALRVPLLPDSMYPRSTKTSYSKEEEEIVMLPEISLASADSTHISTPTAFADVHDNNTVDFHGVTDTLGKVGAAVEEEASGFSRVWNGFLDDVLGAPAAKKA